EHEALVLEGRCVPYGEANPWWPLAEAIRHACGIEQGDTAEAAGAKCRSLMAELTGTTPDDPEVRRVADGLLHIMGDEDALGEVDPQRARQEARRAVRLFITELARRQPLIMVLSELHWADELILDLLASVLDRLADLPVTMVATTRPELDERWHPPHGRHTLISLHLDPLEEADARALASALLESPSDDPVVLALAERSGGNPFFLEELASYLEESTTGRGELPLTLRGLVVARLDALGSEERSLLEDAAVMGRTGTVKALSALAEARHGHVDATLASLAGRDLLALSGGRWEFRSDLVREVVYETLTKSERARRHWVLASWLAEVSGKADRQDEVLEQLAHHYATAAEVVAEVGPVAGVPDDAGRVAVEATSRAASWAVRRELPLAAHRLLDRAVALLDGSDVAVRRRLLVERGHVLTTLRHLDAARADLSEVLSGDDAPMRARAMTELGRLQQMAGDLAASTATLDDALALWAELGDPAGRGEALRQAGLTRFLDGDLATAAVMFADALSIARELGDRRIEAWVLWQMAWLDMGTGDLDAADTHLADAARAFEEAGDTGGIGWVKGLLGYVRYIQGRREEAGAMAASILDDSRDRGDRWALGMIEVLLCSVHMWQGRTEEALQAGLDATSTFASIEDVTGQARALSITARVLAALGRVDEARHTAERAAELARGSTEPGMGRMAVVGVAMHIGDWRTVLDGGGATPTEGFAASEAGTAWGTALLQAGRAEQALAELEQAPLSSGKGAEPGGLSTLALAQVACGRIEQALASAERALTADPPATYRDRALAEVARGFAFLRSGRGTEAERSFGAAADLVRGTGDVVTQAVVALARARALELRGDPEASVAVQGALAWLADAGVHEDGWDTVFRLTAGGVVAA
ncbi:MAG TPA: AAA family ATPase, partial [Acidimicrobiales bacterium]|nr:AAA family ATPase [Acidimicrobiales bacterium]